MTNTVKRQALTKFQFAQLVLKQEGRCGCGCGQKLVFERGQIRDEHLHQIAMGGGNELSNRSLWRLECTKVKDRKDAHARKKVRSLTKATKKSQRPKAKIQSRGFNTPKDYKHKCPKRGFGS
jgi:hypothetical protein